MARRRKKKSKGSKEEPQELVKAPHSFVIHRGRISKSLEYLLQNVRKIMEPFTASKLKVRKKNTIKDFVSISNYLNVTHMIIFTESSIAPYIRLCRLPRGPTITYKILDATLMADIVSKQKRPHINTKLFENSPLLILNGFSNNDDKSIQLQSSMWRNMFPTIDLQKVQLSKIHRCLLLSLNDSSSNQIELRHYAIKVKPIGLTAKIIKNLITNKKKIPDLGKFRTVEDVIEAQFNNGNDSEYDDDNDDEQNKIGQVTLPQQINNKQGNLINEKSSIRLYEIGPRLRLELVKVENGIMCGEVLFHSYIHKTNEEIKEQKQKIEQRNLLRLSRKRQQEENVRRKQQSINNSDGNNKNKKIRLTNDHDVNDTKSSNENKANKDDDDDDDSSDDNDNNQRLAKDNNHDDAEDDCSDYQISDDENMHIFNDSDDDD